MERHDVGGTWAVGSNLSDFAAPRIEGGPHSVFVLGPLIDPHDAGLAAADVVQGRFYDVRRDA